MRLAKAAIDQIFESRIDEIWRPPNLPQSQKEPVDIHQQTMDRAYQDYERKAARVQVGRGLGDREKQSGHRNFLDALSEPEQLAVVFGNLNYQVENGGFQQWVDNGYHEDTIDRLREFSERFQGRYPILAKAMGIIDELEEHAQDFGEDMTLEKMGGREYEEDIGDAISNDDWDRLYNLVGGTDWDERRVNRETEEELRSMIEVTVESESPPSISDTPGQFFWVIKRARMHGPDVELERSETPFKDEDEAYDAGNARADELQKEAMENEDDLYDIAREEVKNRIEKDLRDGLDRDFQRVFERADKEYYTISREVLDSVSSILRTEFNVPSPFGQFFQQAMAKAKHALKGATSAMRQKISTGLGRIGGALTKASQRVRPEESVASSIRRLID